MSSTNTDSRIIDDKSQYCIPFILERLHIHQLYHANNPNPPPFFLGLNGVQGAGKTVLVKTLQDTLSQHQQQQQQQPTEKTPTTTTLTLSLDDIYLTNADQKSLANSHPSNPLLQHRGQPSTHDLALGRSVFDALKEGRETRIPRYDKAVFGGEGDRVDCSFWEVVNNNNNNNNNHDNDGGTKNKINLVIFEGWCVGFRAWDDRTLRRLWEDAVRKRGEKEGIESERGQRSQLQQRQKQGGDDGDSDKKKKEEDTVNPNHIYNGRLGYVRFEDIKVINDALRGYDVLTDTLDALIHIDAQDLHYVYEWRQEQERSLRASKGSGMSDDQIERFVDGYYPSYELYTQTLREGVFKPSSERSTSASSYQSDWQGRQLRLVVDRNRKVKEVIKI